MHQDFVTLRLAGPRQLPSVAPFRGMLEYDDRLETLGEALERAALPGMYHVAPSSGRYAFICNLASNGTAVVHTFKLPQRRPRTKTAQASRPPKVPTIEETRAKVRQSE